MEDDIIPQPLETIYEWEIKNFSMCPQSIDECLKSNTFYVDSVDVSEYQLILYPRGRSRKLEDAYETTLCVLECRRESKFHINVKMFVVFGDEESEMERENFPMKAGDTIDFPIEFREKTLEPAEFVLLPEENFIFRCIVTLVYDYQINERDLHSLSADLENLYVSGRYSDFVLITWEKLRLPVHKIILAARCPGLAKRVDTFDIEGCREGVLPDVVACGVLGAILTYAYSGRLPQDLSSVMMDEIRRMAVEWGMDDLVRDLFPLEVCTMGRTIIPVDRQDVTWTFDDWPAKTFIDIVVGSFDATFSVVTEGDATYAKIGLECQRLNVAGPLTMKCGVRVLMPEIEYSETLCEGEYKFVPEALPGNFNMKDVFLFEYKSKRDGSLNLVFDFTTSHPRGGDRCDKVGGIDARDITEPIGKRSLNRLSSDMDAVFKNLYEGDGRFSDLRVKVDYRENIPAHKCVLWARWERLNSLVNADTYEIEGLIGLRTVHDLLRYLYSGKLSSDASVLNLLTVYDGAVKHGLQSLKRRCLQLLPSKVELKNLQMLLQVSEQRDDGDLKAVAASFIQENRDRIKDTPEWAEIAKEYSSLDS